MVRIWGNFRSMTLIQVGKDIVIDEEDEDHVLYVKMIGQNLRRSVFPARRFPALVSPT